MVLTLSVKKPSAEVYHKASLAFIRGALLQFRQFAEVYGGNFHLISRINMFISPDFGQCK